MKISDCAVCVQVPFMMCTDDPVGAATGSMRNPFMQEVQKHLSTELRAELVSAVEKAVQENVQDGVFSRSMSALVAVAYKP